MKLLMILAPTECLEEIEALVRERDIHAYTEFRDLHGEGKTGGRLGSRAFPGTSSLLMTALPTEQVEGLTDDLAAFAARPENCNQVRVFALPTEQML